MAVVSNSTTTLGDMVSQVYFLISEREDSSVIRKSEVVRAINAGINKIVKKIDRNTTDVETTLPAGIRRIAIPDGVLQNGRVLVDAAYIDGTSITPVSPSIDDGETGEPTGYFIDGNSLVLVPTTDAVYTLEVTYRQEFPPLSNDEDTTTLSDIAITAAVMYACYLMKLKDEEFSAADRFKTEYEDSFKEATTLQSGIYRYTENGYGGAI